MRYKPYVLTAIRRDALNIPIHGVPFKAVRLSRACNALYTLPLKMNYNRVFKLSTLNFTPIS